MIPKLVSIDARRLKLERATLSCNKIGVEYLG